MTTAMLQNKHTHTYQLVTVLSCTKQRNYNC